MNIKDFFSPCNLETLISLLLLLQWVQEAQGDVNLQKMLPDSEWFDYIGQA